MADMWGPYVTSKGLRYLLVSATNEHRSLVIDSAVRSYHCRHVDLDRAALDKAMKEILSRYPVLVAETEDDPVVAGWVCGNDRNVVYTYVTYPYRHLGLAMSMMGELGVKRTATHHFSTPQFSKLWHHYVASLPEG